MRKQDGDRVLGDQEDVWACRQFAQHEDKGGRADDDDDMHGTCIQLLLPQGLRDKFGYSIQQTPVPVCLNSQQVIKIRISQINCLLIVPVL